MSDFHKSCDFPKTLLFEIIKYKQTTYEFDDEGEELIISVSGEEKERHNLKKCYWLDFVAQG